LEYLRKDNRGRRWEGDIVDLLVTPPTESKPLENVRLQ
jgi:hypothetical protein